jgi:uncharacterized protein (DUF2141 family)
MKQTYSIALASLLLAPTLFANTIHFEISGVQSSEGKLYVQLFKGETNYSNGKPEAANIVKAKKGKTTITFNNVDLGEYAIRFFHDENNNGKMESNLFGMPIEGHGFSNNAMPNFGPASFADAKFEVNGAVTTTNTTAIY